MDCPTFWCASQFRSAWEDELEVNFYKYRICFWCISLFFPISGISHTFGRKRSSKRQCVRIGYHSSIRVLLYVLATQGVTTGKWEYRLMGFFLVRVQRSLSAFRAGLFALCRCYAVLPASQSSQDFNPYRWFAFSLKNELQVRLCVSFPFFNSPSEIRLICHLARDANMCWWNWVVTCCSYPLPERFLTPATSWSFEVVVGGGGGGGGGVTTTHKAAIDQRSPRADASVLPEAYLSDGGGGIAWARAHVLLLFWIHSNSLTHFPFPPQNLS